MRYAGSLLTVLVFLPVAAAVLVALLPRAAVRAQKVVALTVTTLVFAISLLLVWGFKPVPAMQFEAVRSWLPAFGISYHVGIDGISLWLVILTTFLTPLALVGSWSSIDRRVREFNVFMLLLEAGMLGVFVALDLFLFYIFWEAMLIPMYFLIGIWGHERRIYAAVKFFLYTMAGSVLMLVAFLVVYRAAGAHSFDIAALAQVPVDPKLQMWLFGAFALAFAIKVPMFPFHTWLPDAHVEAPTAGSVILAGVLLKLGGYGFIRYSLSLYPDAAHTYAPLIIVLSLIAIIYGAVVALVQPDLKKLVAYSSVSHMGFVTLGIFVFQQQAMQGAILQMVNHGLITGALFLLVGVIYERTHDRTIAKMGGLAGLTPVYAAIFGFFVFASAGLPGLSGFVGEFLTLVGTFAANPLVAGIATLVMVLAAAYLLWMFQRVVFGEPSAFLQGLGHHLTEITATEILTLAPLAALVVVFGFFPGILLNLISTPAAGALVDAAHGTAIPIDPLWVALGLGLVAAVVVIRFVSLRPAAPAPTAVVKSAS
jgi:NADH-quinone oxidoreductase subunit M